MLPIDLSDRLAIVTGATGELGRVMVRTLAGAGADVAVHYHSAREKADALVEETEAAGRRAVAVRADITVGEEVTAMRDAVREALGDPDIIVNNAVIQFDWKPVLEQEEEAFESQYRSSILHNVHMAQAFVPAMAEKGWGRVIGINTECSMQCWPNQGAYVSGKRGMDGVLRTLAREVGPKGITVNQVAPGWTISENREDDGSHTGYYEKVALGRRGHDQEIANVVAFLASDLASFVSGVYLPVSGGSVMPGI